jgi:hypothetical protein
MKWYGWTIFSLVLTTAAVTSVAVEPLGSDRSATSARRGYFRPAVIEQSNATAQPERVGSEAPVHYRQATWNIWAGTYNGYVYTPDACDYRPPCIDHLWDGYSQHPLRCDGLHWGGRLWGCRECGHCGMFGRHCGCDCGANVGCDSCVTKVPDCGISKPTCEAEPSCDCGGHGWHPGHHWNGFSHKCRHFWHHCKAHWSCACGTDIGCGCGVETKGDYAPVPASDVPPAPMPEVEEKKASAELERETRAIKLPAVGTGLKGYFQR